MVVPRPVHVLVSFIAKDKFMEAECLNKSVIVREWIRLSRLRVGLVLLGDAMLCVVIVLITQIDRLINSTLYGYGLVFSDAWAQPYWLMLRITMVLTVAAVILISVVELPYPAFEEKIEKDKQEEQKLVVEVPETAENAETTETVIAENLTAEELEEEVSA